MYSIPLSVQHYLVPYYSVAHCIAYYIALRCPVLNCFILLICYALYCFYSPDTCNCLHRFIICVRCHRDNPHQSSTHDHKSYFLCIPLFSHSHSLPLSFTHALSLSLYLSYTHTHTHTLSLTHTHTHSLSLSLLCHYQSTASVISLHPL